MSIQMLSDPLVHVSMMMDGSWGLGLTYESLRPAYRLRSYFRIITRLFSIQRTNFSRALTMGLQFTYHVRSIEHIFNRMVKAKGFALGLLQWETSGQWAMGDGHPSRPLIGLGP